MLRANQNCAIDLFVYQLAIFKKPPRKICLEERFSWFIVFHINHLAVIQSRYRPPIIKPTPRFCCAFFEDAVKFLYSLISHCLVPPLLTTYPLPEKPV